MTASYNQVTAAAFVFVHSAAYPGSNFCAGFQFAACFAQWISPHPPAGAGWRQSALNFVDSLWPIRVISAVIFCRSVMLLKSGHWRSKLDGKVPLLATDNLPVMDSMGFSGRSGYSFQQGMEAAYPRIFRPINPANAIGDRLAACQPEKAGL